MACQKAHNSDISLHEKHLAHPREQQLQSFRKYCVTQRPSCHRARCRSTGRRGQKGRQLANGRVEMQTRSRVRRGLCRMAQELQSELRSCLENKDVRTRTKNMYTVCYQNAM